jgi:hypothetical protein
MTDTLYAGDYIGLVVGINNYADGKSLEAAVRDANAIADVLEHDGDAEKTPRWALKRLVDCVPGKNGEMKRKKVTATKVTSAIEELLDASAGRHVLFWFSGHGSAPRGNLRLDTARGVVPTKGLIDEFNACEAKSVTIVLDCCFSGAMGDEPKVYESGSVPTSRPGAIIRENLAVMTACRGSEETPDGEVHSPFTHLLLAGLKGGAADHQGAISIVDLFSHVSGYFLPTEPRPQLKINMTAEPFVLRRIEPRVPQHVLDQLVTWFEDPDLPKALKPEHEGPAGDRPEWPMEERTAMQKEFDDIGRVRNLGMIESVRKENGEEEPLYWVAKRGGEVQLTSLGKWYWAKVDRLLGRNR